MATITRTALRCRRLAAQANRSGAAWLMLRGEKSFMAHPQAASSSRKLIWFEPASAASIRVLFLDRYGFKSKRRRLVCILTNRHARNTSVSLTSLKLRAYGSHQTNRVSEYLTMTYPVLITIALKLVRLDSHNSLHFSARSIRAFAGFPNELVSWSSSLIGGGS